MIFLLERYLCANIYSIPNVLIVGLSLGFKNLNLNVHFVMLLFLLLKLKRLRDKGERKIKNLNHKEKVLVKRTQIVFLVQIGEANYNRTRREQKLTIMDKSITKIKIVWMVEEVENNQIKT